MVCSKCGSPDYDSFSTAFGEPRGYCRNCCDMVRLVEPGWKPSWPDVYQDKEEDSK